MMRRSLFSDKERVRQGDLINVVADMLAILIKRSKDQDMFDGLVPHLVDGGHYIMQYADDTIIFIDDDIVKARNLKLLLCTFEKLSGLKINFHKSDLFCFGEIKERIAQYVDQFGCKEWELPFRYLGIPMNYCKLSNKD
jgi:hypothetical protein